MPNPYDDYIYDDPDIIDDDFPPTGGELDSE